MWIEGRTMHHFSLHALILRGQPKRKWFGGGVFFSHGRIRQEISRPQGSLRLVRVGVFLFVDILHEFLERGKPCFLLDAILMPGPRQTLRGTTLFSER